jgi:hypothetical protein
MLELTSFPLTLTLAVTLGAATARAQCAPASNAPRGAWDASNAKLAPGTHPSADGVALVHGIACRPDLQIDDGVIEFELAPAAGGFAGIAFRMQSSADYEIVYFRWSSDGRWVGVQYQPVYEGETTWQLYPGTGYEADLPPRVYTRRGGWMPVRLVIAGSRADVFVGDSAEPVLHVEELKRPRARGAIAIWSSGQDTWKQPTARVRALRVMPLGNLTLAAMPAAKAAPNALTRWRVSSRFAAPDSIAFPDRLPADARRDISEARVVNAEASGTVNLTSIVGNPAGRQTTNVFGGAGWGVAYASVTLRSDRDQTRRLSVSYSDAIGVYVDGALVYTGDNRTEVRGKNQLGLVGYEAETIPLRLRAGDNEIVLAVSDRAFGWGFRARLDSLGGVTVTP